MNKDLTTEEMALLAYRALYGWVNAETGKRVRGLLERFDSLDNYYRVVIVCISIITLHFLGVPTEYIARFVSFVLGIFHA